MPSKNSIAAVPRQQQSKPVLPNNTQEAPKKAKVQRINKGFQVEANRATQWDLLVAKMKNNAENKKTGPELMDEAMDYIFKKYSTS